MVAFNIKLFSSHEFQINDLFLIGLLVEYVVVKMIIVSTFLSLSKIGALIFSLEEVCL